MSRNRRQKLGGTRANLSLQCRLTELLPWNSKQKRKADEVECLAIMPVRGRAYDICCPASGSQGNATFEGVLIPTWDGFLLISLGILVLMGRSVIQLAHVEAT